MLKKECLLIFLIACSSLQNVERSPSSAFVESLPLRDASLLPGPVQTERAYRVTTAQVVWADYDLIRKDFPHLSQASDQAVDDWLKKHAIVSGAQAAQEEFNTKIAVDPNPIDAIRPNQYGRGLVLDTGDGLLDIKGAGSNNPRYDWEDGDPRNGNMTLGEAIREQLFEEVESKIFIAEDADINVLRSYAIISPGFDVVHRNAQRQNLGTSSAGMLFRQAHTRFTNPGAEHVADSGKYFLWDQARSLKVEKILRKYGITSEGAGRPAGAIEGGINIQGTKGNTILDFGNHIVNNHFTMRPVYHFYGDQPLLGPGLEYPQPVNYLALPYGDWGPYKVGNVDSKSDKPWVYAHQLATHIGEELKQGHVFQAREAMKNHRKNMLRPWLMKINGVNSVSPNCKSLIEMILTKF
jgi:hypothetical protein